MLLSDTATPPMTALNGPALVVRDLTKLYPVFGKSLDGIRYLYHAIRGNRAYVEGINHVTALSGLTFTIERGERVGLVGRNGSGKTTLLQVIANYLSPNRGSVTLNGEVYSLSAKNVGFDPEATSRQNAISFLSLHNLSKELVAERVREIENFLEFGPYFDQPIKFCSLGMRARAEFAAATAVDASLVLIDEVLGAGDMYWAERCAQRLEKYCAEGRSMMLVSHSMDQVLRYCDRVIWIDGGRLVMDGPAHDVVRRYATYLEKLAWNTDDVEDKSYNAEDLKAGYLDIVLPDSGSHVIRWPGQGGVLFNGIWVNDRADAVVAVDRAEPIRIRFTIKAGQVGLYLLRYHLNFWGANGKRLGVAENDRHAISLEESAAHAISLEIPGNVIGAGRYYISIAIYDLSHTDTSANEFDTRQDMLYKSIELIVQDGDGSSGDRGPLANAYFDVPFDLKSEPGCSV